LAKAAAAISAASLIVPFVLGVLLAAALSGRIGPADGSRAGFILFMGVAMAVTAFPVLARILTDRGMARSDMGVLALSCAAVGDVAAWWLLAIVAGVVKSAAGGAI